MALPIIVRKSEFAQFVLLEDFFSMYFPFDLTQQLDILDMNRKSKKEKKDQTNQEVTHARIFPSRDFWNIQMSSVV